ncbi:MAG: tRNA (N(6)-L-threonylcarbamoyladenosine(37)-C(2))-methylthiotransferase MtaB [Kordiimonas sp.]|nr:tRNA (N(6)-L-threonylcarbamoyladenosine(37)-C(2))-methylthiotransferase MtaB [Kordiimonas sp.]|tara:strand:+ start:4415 stop:5740 length:1326 start_codon:yes stop_codon:yes gene_type:complete
MTQYNRPTRQQPEVVTFGCRLNTYESEVIRSHATTAGLNNAIIFNTCTVTAEATRQARQAIRRAHRENPDAQIIVTGCAAQVDPEQFAQMDEVHKVLGNTEKMDLQYYQVPTQDFGIADSEKVSVNDIMSVTETAGHLISGFEERSRAFIQIQNGCDHRCTFCVIPYGRGNSRSVPAGEVIKQIQHLVEQGYREVVLTGVDITSYGADLPGPSSLGLLCQTILKLVPDLPRLRLSSIDSIEADDTLFDVITTQERLMPHLHLSLQSGDNMILKRMKRRHSREDSIEFCQRVRAARPDMVFGADFITGFPTETDEMFNNTLRLVDECDLTMLHVFPYSEREGTPAALIPGKIPGDVRKARAARLRAAGDARQDAFLQQQVGQTRSILLEKATDQPGTYLGHTEHFTPVRLNGPADGPALKTGHIVSARITGYKDGILHADVL